MPSKKWRSKQLVKDLCVVGHGRGATSFAAKWLQENGLDVGHEQVGPRGIVESGFATPTWGCRGGLNQGLTRDFFVFKNKITILRDPYKVIATYAQIEHPRAIFAHGEHLPGLFDEWLPKIWDLLSEPEQETWLEEDNPLRINTIARSVVRWTQMGIDWTTDWMRAEDQWQEEMPAWLLSRGLWTADQIVQTVPKDTINHRKGIRMSREEISAYLRPDVQQELDQYRTRYGYNG